MAGQETVDSPVMTAYALIDGDSEAGYHEVPKPGPAPNEVLVRIAAASVNPHDSGVRSRAAARYMTYEYPVILGSDFAGVVEETGHDVRDLEPGDRVFGLVRELVAARGTLAPFVAVPREWIARTPPAVSDLDAAVFGLAALGALRCVAAAEPLAPGQTVLVNGATGGIGGYVIHLLAARGVNVIATARHGDQADYVRGLGASETVDWEDADLAQVVALAHPEGVDALIDLVTTDQAALTELARATVKNGGRVASTRHAVAPSGIRAVVAQNLIIEIDNEALEQIAALADSGVLRAPRVTTFEWPRASEAFALLERGTIGKIAVLPPSSSPSPSNEGNVDVTLP